MIVVAKEPVPLPVTGPVSVIVWSPVLLPDEVPVCVPVRLVPVTVPVEATEVGVIAPRPKEMAGVVVEVPTEAVMPSAAVTDTLVTVPPVPVAERTVPVNEIPVPRLISSTAPALLTLPSRRLAVITVRPEVVIGPTGTAPSVVR